MVIAIQVICVQEQEHPPPGLMADTFFLVIGSGFGEQDPAGAITWRRDNYPAFHLIQPGILHQLKPEFAGIKTDCFIIIPHHQRYQCQVLIHIIDSAVQKSCSQNY
jgi:hypothetical protein